MMRKFMVRYGPVMIQRRGYWQYVDYYGQVFRLEPTQSREDPPLIITCEDRN